MDGKPPYEVVDAQPLMVLPDANKGDLFFDFEGDPLWTVDGREWGLEYLWGDPRPRTTEFHPFWAHDRASERKAFVDFLAMVRSGSSATPACTSTTTRPTRRARCCGWPADTESARTT